MVSYKKELFQIGCVGLLTMQFGLHMAILNAPMQYMACDGVEREDQDCIPGWSPAIPTSIYAIGGLLGSAATGPLIARWGVYVSLLLSAIFLSFGSMLVTCSTTMPQIIQARLAVGIGAGSSIVGAPILTNRLSPAGYVGVIGPVTQLTANMGIIVAQALGIATTNWRLIMLDASILSLVALALVAFCFGAFRHSLPSHQHALSSTELAEEPELERHVVGTTEFLTSSRYRYALITALSIFAVQQLTGINSIIQYGVRVMTSIMPEHAALLNLFLSVVNLVVTFLSGFIIDKTGRKRLLLYSLGSMSFGTAALAFGLVRGLTGFSAIASVLTIAAFAIGIGPIPFMYVSEFTPREAVGVAQSLGTVSSWLSTFAVLLTFPTLQSHWGPSVFYVFSVCTLGATIWYSQWLVPDKH